MRHQSDNKFQDSPKITKFSHIQGSPQVLRTWGGEGLNLYMGGGEWEIGRVGGGKMLLKYICEGVHMLVKLPA